MKLLGEPKDEYFDVCETMRHFGNIRFAQMTLFLALTAGILTVLFQGAEMLQSAILSLKIGAIVITVLFWIMDSRAMIYWNHFRMRAIELEEILGFEQWKNSPASRFLSTTNALRILYSLILGFWFFTLFW